MFFFWDFGSHFLSGDVTDDISNLRGGHGGALSAPGAFKPVDWHPREAIRVTSGLSAHIYTCGCMVSQNNTFTTCELW